MGVRSGLLSARTKAYCAQQQPLRDDCYYKNGLAVGQIYAAPHLLTALALWAVRFCAESTNFRSAASSMRSLLDDPAAQMANTGFMGVLHNG